MAIVLLSLSFCVAAEADFAAGDYSLTFVSSIDGSTQPYRLFVPSGFENGKPVALLVVLHGKGVDQDAWFDYTPIKEHAEKHRFVVVAPNGRGDYFYRGPGEQDVLDAISAVAAELSVAPDQVYLMGHSMGGWGAWWVALRNPSLFACTVPMAHFFPEGLLTNARHLHPLMIHSADDPIVPVGNSRKAAEQLEQLGIDFRYLEKDGYGHASKIIGDHLDEAFAWLKEHPRIDFPSRITFATRTPRKGKAYWVKILETMAYPRIAEVEAKWNSDRSLNVDTKNVKTLAIELDALPLEHEQYPYLEIDGQGIVIPQTYGWALLRRGRSKIDWTYEPQLHEPDPQPPEVLTYMESPIVMSASPGWFSRTVGSVVRRETNADLCLFSDDMFQRRLASGAVTNDDLLDLYVYPNDRLFRTTLSGEAIRSLLELEPPLGCGWWGALQMDRDVELDASKTYEVVMPDVIAKSFRYHGQGLPLPVC